MKKYFLMHKDRLVAGFVVKDTEVVEAFLSKKNADYIPLPIRKVLHFKGYVDSIEGNFIHLNEEGMYSLEDWLNNRSIPVNRDNIFRYLSNRHNTVGLMFENHSCSLTDCYWTMQVGENLTWKQVKLYGSSNIDSLQVIDRKATQGTIYSGINSTLGGCLEKYWFSVEDNIYLAKKTTLNDAVLNAREVLASKIYKALGYDNYVSYRYIRNTEGQIVGSKCKSFTSEQLELITVYDLLEEWGLSQANGIYNNIVGLAVEYGANEGRVRRQLDVQTIVDYLITNRDRHQSNIGFLRDSDTLKIVDIAPIFDSGSTKYLEGERPEGVDCTKVHNLYNTEIECLNSVSDFSVLDYSKLPSVDDIIGEFSKIDNISDLRVNQLGNLYLNKLKFLESNYLYI